jgi:hypothetical protein
VTFTYPSNWSAPHLNASGYRQVELDPYNGIFVAPAASNLKLKGTYAVANLTQSLESHGGVSMKLVNYDVPNNGNLHQQNYVFTSHGSTWEISCYSQPAFRRYIKSACLKAIGSVKVSP